MRKILVTAISGDVANGILKALKETQDEIYGCDIYDYPVGMDKVISFWKSDLAVDPYYIEHLLEKCKELEITHLIPVNEQEIKAVSEHIEEFRENGIKVVINRPDLIDIFLDKYKTYEYLNNVDGIYVPRTYTCSEFEEDGKEYIVKLKNSCGSKFLKVIKTKQQLEELNLKEEDYIVQEYLTDGTEEYTVGVFSNGEKTVVIIFKRKLEHGHTSFVELVQDASIENAAVTIAKKIRLQGYINIQLRKQNKKNYIFEINPRISGTIYFRHMLGFKDALWWLDLLDEKHDFQYIHKYKEAIGIRELSEKFIVLQQ